MSKLSYFQDLCGLFPTKFTKHAHKCRNKSCGTVWVHDPNAPEMQNHTNYNLAHHCPDCGREEFFVHKNTTEATCFFDGVKKIFRYKPYV